MEAGVYDYGTVYTVTEEQMSRAVLIDALTRGFTEHLVDHRLASRGEIRLDSH